MASSERASVSLRVIPEERLTPWIEHTARQYIASRERMGESTVDADAAARRSLETAFPDGRVADGHLVFDILADDEPVGVLWLGPHPMRHDDRSWWVNDIEIDEAHRGRGYGREAMQLAEAVVHAEDGRTLGLNVFGFNHAARALYESLGYEVDALQMSKRV